MSYVLSSLGLVLSAGLLGSAESGHHLGWLGYIGLLPLFSMVRCFTPGRAGVFGAFWGSCVWIMALPGYQGHALTSVLGLMWVLAASFGFGALASLFHRRLRVGPFHIAVAWLLFEIALLPLNRPFGLLAATQQGSAFFSLIGGLFGYLLVAFVVAYFNALILCLVIRLGETHWSMIAFVSCGVHLRPNSTSTIRRSLEQLQCLFARPPPTCFPLFA